MRSREIMPRRQINLLVFLPSINELVDIALSRLEFGMQYVAESSR